MSKRILLWGAVIVLVIACGEESPWSDGAVRISPLRLTLVDFAWSVNGEFVASDGVNLWFFDGEGRNVRKIEGSELFGKMVNGEGLCWSPDGNYVAFTVRENPDGYWANIFIIHREANSIWEARRLTDSFGTNPAWSPDGNWILYNNQDTIFVIPAQGGEPRFLVSNARWPAWGPGGEYFAFQRQFEGLAWDIMAKPFKGGPARRVTYFNEYVKEPAWAPNGEHIAITVEIIKEYKGADIWVVSVKEGSAAKITDEPLTKRRLEASRPAWSTDGQWIAFLSRRGGEPKGPLGGAVWKVPFKYKIRYW